ncbi:MAG: 1,4-dihydroxy-6-naphthoate synthase [Thermodesulfobacteriota bacterium]
MLSLAFSPCPNDTFIFHAMTHGLVRSEGLHFDKPLLADVETLNSWALDGKYDVTKLSFHALGHVLDKYVLLDSGSALGRGCGPLLVTRQGGEIDLAEAIVAIPGEYTTAAMLLQLYAPCPVKTKVMVFDQIINAVGQGEVDSGVIIHESRFTYHEHGLSCVQDLGEWWEETTGQPIPLGGIAAKRSLGEAKISLIEKLIKDSVQYGFKQPDASRDYIKKHAQEMNGEIISNHIGLYVNNFSESLGEEGHRAVDFFLHLGREKGLFK